MIRNIFLGMVGLIALIPYSIGMVFLLLASVIILDFKGFKALISTWDSSAKS